MTRYDYTQTMHNLPLTGVSQRLTPPGDDPAWEPIGAPAWIPPTSGKSDGVLVYTWRRPTGVDWFGEDEDPDSWPAW